jgi:hypothetical protein
VSAIETGHVEKGKNKRWRAKQEKDAHASLVGLGAGGPARAVRIARLGKHETISGFSGGIVHADQNAG